MANVTINGTDYTGVDEVCLPITNGGGAEQSFVLAGAHNYEYDGANLKTIFETAAAFHTAVADGDFGRIHVGDYWPITPTGSYYDYGEGTVAGQYQPKTFSNDVVVNLEVAAINPYWRYGDSGNLTGNLPHVLFVSRDCLPATYKMRKTTGVWEDTTTKNPWLGSALYKTFNDPNHGIITLVAATDIGDYIYAGADGKGMRYYGEVRSTTSATTSTGDWFGRGKLFLPTEDEIWGREIFAVRNSHGMLGLPIFAGTRRHIMKEQGNGGSRGRWWTMSAVEGSSTDFCTVNTYGAPNKTTATTTTAYTAPLCFLVA